MAKFNKMRVLRRNEFSVELYIITKDGEPYNHSNMKKDTFVKAYYDKSLAEKTAKAFCTSDSNYYYRHGKGYYDNEDKNSLERKEMAKKLAKSEMKRWKVIEVNV